MQTFMPYGSIEASVQALDNKRLGKQRVEAYQILRALTGVTKGWVHHPATRMWAGHESGLAQYGIACCDEWIRRGFEDNLRDKLLEFYDPSEQDNMPWWFGLEEFHSSHRAALLEKEPTHYSLFGWTDRWLGYWWPTKQEVQA